MFFTSIAARTDLGLVRTGNEDSALHHPKLIAVADGMGGAVGGEIASKIAIQTLASRINALASEEMDDDSRIDILQSTLTDVESELAARIDSTPELLGMGTTLTALLALEKSVAMLHIGDSRAYRIRDGEITRLSHDHTVVQELIDQGKISLLEAEEHPQRSMLTEALMGRGSKDPDLENFPIQLFPVEDGDIYLLASDGLTAVLKDEVIAMITSKTPLDQAANNLIAAVRDGGAPDNVTIILSHFGKSIDESREVSFLGAAHE